MMIRHVSDVTTAEQRVVRSGTLFVVFIAPPGSPEKKVGNLDVLLSHSQTHTRPTNSGLTPQENYAARGSVDRGTGWTLNVGARETVATRTAVLLDTGCTEPTDNPIEFRTGALSHNHHVLAISFCFFVRGTVSTAP